MSRAHLEYVRAWAASKLSAGADQTRSPYAALRESLDAVLANRECVAAGDDTNLPAPAPTLPLARGWPRLRIAGLTIRSL